MIRRFCAVLVGIAVTWLCALAGLVRLDEATTFRCPSKPRMARMKAIEVMQALEQFEIDNNRCPTGNDELLEGRYVTAHALVDPWGTAIAFSCSGRDFHARSAGADRTFGTPDDITPE